MLLKNKLIETKKIYIFNSNFSHFFRLMNSNTSSNDFQYVQLQWLDELLRLSSLQIK